MGSNNLNEHFEGQESDCLIMVNGEIIKSHKSVLSMTSGFFKELYESALTKDSTLVLLGAEFEDVNLLMNLIYKRSIEIDQSKIESFLKIANLFKINLVDYDLNIQLKPRKQIEKEVPSANKNNHREDVVTSEKSKLGARNAEVDIKNISSANINPGSIPISITIISNPITEPNEPVNDVKLSDPVSNEKQVEKILRYRLKSRNFSVGECLASTRGKRSSKLTEKAQLRRNSLPFAGALKAKRKIECKDIFSKQFIKNLRIDQEYMPANLGAYKKILKGL